MQTDHNMTEFLELLKELKPHIDFLSCDNLVEEGVLDSLDIFDIMDAIETKYGITLDGEDIDPDHFVTPQAMWDLVQRHLAS